MVKKSNLLELFYFTAAGIKYIYCEAAVKNLPVFHHYANNISISSWIILVTLNIALVGDKRRMQLRKLIAAYGETLLTLVMLNQLRWHTHFQFSAN